MTRPASALVAELADALCADADLAAELADLVAERVVDRLRDDPGPDVPEPPPQAGGLVDAAEVARRCGVSAAWVREHRDELGVVRLGDGPRPRLRFDLARVEAALEARASREAGRRSDDAGSPAATDVSRRRRRRSRRTGGQSGPELLPIRGRDA